MKEVDRWLLPDGIEEMLPGEASQVEELRRSVVNVFQTWGYDYVITPMVEFTDSLLTGSGEDISLLTFKLTDQLSGKMMGLRADITPQVARMDAHSLKREGINRLCYAGHVAHTRAKSPLSSRTPIQAGVELFGEPSLDADIEVISLLITTLQRAGLEEQFLDLGHVGIYRALSRAVGFSHPQEVALFELLQAKAMTDIQHWLDAELDDSGQRQWFIDLAQLSGGVEVIAEARAIYAGAPEGICSTINAALDQLDEVSRTLSLRYPKAHLYFDLCELRGYHYLSGLVFGAFAAGAGTAIGSGGRYDHVGEAFGRPRSAVGFAVDLSVLRRLLPNQEKATKGIFAPLVQSSEYWQRVSELRNQGERVVSGYSDQREPHAYQTCDRLLIKTDNGQFRVVNWPAPEPKEI